MASNCASNIKEEVPEVLINYCTIQCLLSENFITSRFVSLPKHLLIRRSNLLSRLPRFIRKLSKMEYIWVIQNGGSKKADCSSYLFQKWATSSWHHCYCLKLLMLTCWLYHKAFFLFIYLFIFFLLRLLQGKFGFRQKIQQNDVKLRHCVNQIMLRCWKRWEHHLLLFLETIL